MTAPRSWIEKRVQWARHNALREAVAWEREIDALLGLIPNFWEDDNIAGTEAIRSHSAARAEVDRLVEKE